MATAVQSAHRCAKPGAKGVVGFSTSRCDRPRRSSMMRRRSEAVVGRWFVETAAGRGCPHSRTNVRLQTRPSTRLPVPPAAPKCAITW
jgi:hypothetical protein